MRNSSLKICRENKNTYFILNNSFSENRDVNEIMLKNMINSDWPKATVEYGVCALHAVYQRLQKHSEYVIVITFIRQQLFHKFLWILLYTYIALLFLVSVWGGWRYKTFWFDFYQEFPAFKQLCFLNVNLTFSNGPEYLQLCLIYSM